MTSPARDVPPVVPWPAFVNSQVQRTRELSTGDLKKTKTTPSRKNVVGAKGVHRLFDGMTQSGKSTANRILLRMAKTSIVFGTKPNNDSALEDYITKEGYVRITSWPPKPKDLRLRGPREQVKLLLWPEIKEYADLRGKASMFKAALQDLAIEPFWTISIDEGYWCCTRKGLNLGEEVADIAYGGASNGTSLHILTQRPRHIPPIIPSSCHEGYFFRAGGTNDLRELASYTSYESRDFAQAIRNLNRGNPTKGHQFLYAPLAGGAQWAVSEIPKDFAT